MTERLLLNNYSPVVYLAIFILVSKVKHLVNVLLPHWHRQVPHHELKVTLGEEFVLDFVLLRSEVGWVGVCTTDNLEIRLKLDQQLLRVTLKKVWLRSSLLSSLYFLSTSLQKSGK